MKRTLTTALVISCLFIAVATNYSANTAINRNMTINNSLQENGLRNDISATTLAEPFTEDTTVSLPGVQFSSVAWGDYDNDNDLDILLTGESGSGAVSMIYKNENGSFININAGLTGVFKGSAAWGDYDNDGDLDILIAGSGISKVYKNDAGSFKDINAGLVGVYFSSVAWGDYDNDGDLDILLTGYTGSSNVSKLYRNNSGKFTEIEVPLLAVSSGSVAWGDYDNDEDLDILLTGNASSSVPPYGVSKLYRNHLGSFVDTSVNLIGVYNGSVARGDYDNDGYLDVLLTGSSDLGSIFNSKIYLNDRGSLLPNSTVALKAISKSCAAWGDYDNDGDLDILLTGDSDSGPTSKVYRNNGGIFEEISTELRSVKQGSVAWGDYDNDGDLDILLTGIDNNSNRISKIYRNNIATPNTVPNPPTSLVASVIGYTVTLSWNKSNDNQTAQKALTYNLRLGTLSGGVEKVSPMAEVSIGYRRVSGLGNTNHKNRWKIKYLSPGTYYWSVQAIDNAFAGSSFAPEQSFIIPTDTDSPKAPQMLTRSASEREGEIILSWKANSEVDLSFYRLYRSTNSPANTVIDTVEPSDTTYTDRNLLNDITYFYRITAVEQAGNESDFSNEISVILPLTPFTEISSVTKVLTGISFGPEAWGDYDDDGRLDIVLGSLFGSSDVEIYRNVGNTFVKTHILRGLGPQSTTWGDYDNDGDLDILLTGNDGSGGYARVYRNAPGKFVDIDARLTGVALGSAAWGDYDNDGDLDILLIGSANLVNIAKIYRNDSLSFVDINASLTGVAVGAVSWGDYDNDGDLDILLTGAISPNSISKIYRNDSGSFVDINVPFIGISNGSVDWGDYDNDGDLDVLLTGWTPLSPVTKIYRNNNGVFEDARTSLPGAAFGNAKWGDYDNDGDLDILLTGRDPNYKRISKVYQNESGNFIELPTLLTAVEQSFAEWGDFDNDGDLDILLTGQDSSYNIISKVYRNNIKTPNTVPTSPANLMTTLKGDSATFNWSKAADIQTKQNALTYNLRLGTTPGGAEIVSPMSDTSTGFRKLPQLGNTNQNAKWIIKKLPPGTYYWSVQAIDNAFAGSAFAPEQSFAFNAAALVLNPTSLNFNNVKVGDSLGQNLQIRNAGTLSLMVRRINLAGNNTDQFAIVGATSFTVEPNQARNLTVRFKPSSAGPKQASLIIEHNTAGSPTTVNLSGNQGMPAFQLNTISLDFGNVQVGNVLNDTLIVFNPGSAALNVASITISGANAAEFSLLSATNFNVDPNASAMVVIRLRPDSTGSKNASLRITHNAAGSPSTVSLRGTGVSGALAINPDPLTFGAINIGDSAVTQIAITNIGSANLTVTNIFILGKDSLEFSLQGTSSFIINIGQEQKVALRFRPRNLGNKNALLKILHDAPGGDIAVSLSGRGADFKPPKILTADAPTIVNLSMSVLVSADVTDNYAVQKVWLRYREGGRTSYDSTTMNLIEAHYKTNIPGSFAGARGVEFQIIAIDSSGNDSLSGWCAVRVRLPDKHLSKNHLGGSSQNAYRLISFPIASDDASVNATLLDDLGAADTTKWRLWDIDPQRRELQFPYREYPNVGDLAPGKAMFLITQENKMLTSGVGVTVATLTPLQISLQPGWNMISSPFNFEIPIQNVQPESLRKDLYTYNGAWQSSPSKLQPWEGYMIKAKAAVTLTILPSETAPIPLAKSTLTADWLIHLEAECENARDYDNFAGVIPDAAMEWDCHERFEPPPIGEFVMVSFPHRDWPRYPDVYTTDFRPPTADGYTWDFTVDTNISGKQVTLRFDNLESVPPELEVRLVDINLKIAQDLRREAQYVYRSHRDGGKKSFRLLVGKANFITEQSTNVIAVPTSFELAQNFPNPFNPSTSIKFGLPEKSSVSLKIYNLLGKEIATLLNGEEKDAGYHAVVWEGKDRSGNATPSGIYLCRLQAGKTVLTKKLTLIK